MEEKEEETEEPDSDDDVVEDAIDEWDGEDPSEAEVAQFCQPPEQLILSGWCAKLSYFDC